MKFTEEDYTDAKNAHLDRVNFLRSQIAYGDWKEVVKICNESGEEIGSTMHAINIIRSVNSKKHMAVFNALESVIEKRLQQFKS
ncbi:hypothetical protein [Brumimicrobium mesophilum]|uniref:hypothetical protein n=1 Tax=Brumimicrobium mesophilum TaxID=392717 RepID=UPI000D14063B|nr:hypothetical protein [Brumimicrobium mesophilum]